MPQSAPSADARRRPDDDPDGSDRRWLLVAATVALVLFDAGFVLMAASPAGVLAPMIAFGVLLLVNPILEWTGRWRRLPAILACLEAVVVVAWASYQTGGFDILTVTWNPAIPLVATFLVSPRFGLATAGLVLGEFGALVALHHAGYEFPRALAEADLEWLQLMGTASLVVIVALTAWFHEGSRRRAAAATTEARRAAEQSVRTKSEFVANMSHELRTPMHAILGHTGALLGTRLEPDQRAALETVRRSGLHLLQLLDQVLDYSRADAGRLELERTRVDVRTVAEDVVDLLGATARAKGLELCLLVGPGVPTVVLGDPGRLRQVLVNLVGNALKFTERGHVLVRIATDRAEGDALVLGFEIEDTGIGIPDAFRTRIFEAFVQADASNTREHGGTGLGLAVSRRIVRAMGGDIEFQSQPGQGTTFRFTGQFGSVPGVSALEGERDAELCGLRALVVDDVRASRAVLESILGAWGVEVTAAVDGARAVAALHAACREGRRYDLVIADLEMPGMDGWELTRAISGDAALSDTPVVGLAWIAIRSQSLPPTSGWIAKPVRRAELHRAIRRALGFASAPLASEPTVPVAEKPDTARGRVLVVEDDAVAQEVTVLMVERLGYPVDVAATGVEAVNAWLRGRYDVVLMDCQMPVMDGFRATAEIRRREEAAVAAAQDASEETGRPPRRATPIVAMTAHAGARERRQCLEAGMDDFLAKPVDPGDLARTLARWTRASVAGWSPDDAPPKQSAADDAALDLTVLDRLRFLQREGGPDVVQELIALFLDDAPRGIAAVREAVTGADAHAMERAAHRLKSASANLGAVGVARIAAEMEEAGRAGTLVKADELLQRLDRAFERAREALVERGTSHASGSVERAAGREG